MRHTHYDCDVGCPVEAALEILGGKWKGAILYHLLDGAKRFNEIQRLKPELTHRVLTKQLRELEAAGVIERKVFPEVPPRVEYALTELGRALEPVLQTLKMWGIEYLFKLFEQNQNVPDTALNPDARNNARAG